MGLFLLACVECICTEPFAFALQKPLLVIADEEILPHSSAQPSLLWFSAFFSSYLRKQMNRSPSVLAGFSSERLHVSSARLSHQPGKKAYTSFINRLISTAWFTCADSTLFTLSRSISCRANEFPLICMLMNLLPWLPGLSSSKSNFAVSWGILIEIEIGGQWGRRESPQVQQSL